MSSKFAVLLREQREKRGLSQAELAQRASLQPSAISHFEAGRRAPSFDNLRRLADALDVTVDLLLSRENLNKAAGPTVERLFRNWDQMTAADQELLADFAKTLAEKSNQRK